MSSMAKILESFEEIPKLYHTTLRLVGSGKTYGEIKSQLLSQFLNRNTVITQLETQIRNFNKHADLTTLGIELDAIYAISD